ncbi:MAG: hypothetical protein EOL88_02500 [Bacteroidia bacterium]|nr:hypothetical protein [Bacteroidia bacterium]
MNIEKFSDSNMVGFQMLSYAYKSSVKSISKPDGNLQVEIVMQSEADWKQIYFTIETGQFYIRQKSDESGNYYDIEVNVKIPKVRGNVGALLEDLRNRDLLLKITDNNQQDWLVGTLEQPVRLKFDGVLSWNDTNSFSVQFQIESDTHPYLLTETISGGAFSNGFSNGFSI